MKEKTFIRVDLSFDTDNMKEVFEQISKLDGVTINKILRRRDMDVFE